MSQAFELELINWVRLTVLILCFGGAAYLDHKTRRVSNEWWWGWAKPAVFLLCLELIVLEADWMVWLTASAALALASTALIGRPDLGDLLRGSLVDWVVTLWYLASGIGLAMGAMLHGPVLLDHFDAEKAWLLDSNAETMALLWGQMVLIGVVVLFFEMAWRFRLLHGGADAKAMMMAALLLPSWNGAAFPLMVKVDSTAMPPAVLKAPRALRRQLAILCASYAPPVAVTDRSAAHPFRLLPPGCRRIDELHECQRIRRRQYRHADEQARQQQGAGASGA